jgi:CheY-like chemotaxis protein
LNVAPLKKFAFIFRGTELLPLSYNKETIQFTTNSNSMKLTNPVELAMVVDDGLLDALLIKNSLISLDFAKEVMVFDSPDEAYAYIEKASKAKAYNYIPDIIFMDIYMPQISGFDLIEKLNLLPSFVTKNTKIIMTSSSDSMEDIKKSREYFNVVNYLVKPISKLDLLNCAEGELLKLKAS